MKRHIKDKRKKRAPPAPSHGWRQRALALTFLCLLLLIGLGVLGIMFYTTLKIEMGKLNKLQNFKEELQRNVSLQLIHNMNSSKMIRDLSITLQEIATKLCHELYKREPEHKCKPCPKTWMWHEDNCYILIDNYETWQESVMFCSAQNASLLTIKNKSVLEFIKSKRLRNYWLGLTTGKYPTNYQRLDETIFSSNCMPEEVTYATLRFPNASKSKKSEESYSLQRTDNHEGPETEMDGEAENRAAGVESTAELAESRAVPGHSTQCKVWCTVAFISMTVNLVVLAGLGTLGLMNYWKLICNNRTANDIEQSKIQQLEENVTQYMNMYHNASQEHIIFKNKTENTLEKLNNFTSAYCEDLKEKKNDFEFHSCSESWMWYGNGNQCHAQMNTDNKTTCNQTQLFFRCLPSPIPRINLNCTLQKRNQEEESVLKFCIVTCELPCHLLLVYNKGNLMLILAMSLWQPSSMCGQNGSREDKKSLGAFACSSGNSFSANKSVLDRRSS
uniref:C-type lectin domain family 12 member A n=1 Tax=Ailuropoda melanoleuca TaxID=9646 RepID=A0A7N5JWQ0_AILME